MTKTLLTIGLNDKDTEQQEIKSPEAKNIIANILINKYNIFAFTMIDCSGVYKMQSTGAIIFEPSIRIEIASDTIIPIDKIYNELKTVLNQETIMVEYEQKEINFI